MGETDRKALTAHEKYNVVTDTIIGINMRWSDNAVQGAIVAVFAALGAASGAFFIPGSDPALSEAVTAREGAIIGLVIGVILGGFVSGGLIGIFRFVKHLKGQHE